MDTRNRRYILALIYTHQRSKQKKTKKSASRLLAERQHQEFLLKHGITKEKKVRSATSFPDLSVPQRKVAPLSNNIPANGFKRSIDDYKWKNTTERKEVIEETERKRQRVAPYTNKGAYMYVTDADDAKNLGRKV